MCGSFYSISITNQNHFFVAAEVFRQNAYNSIVYIKLFLFI